jgi:sugar phosphate isomerase/epimerase
MRAGVAGMFPMNLALVNDEVAKRIRSAGFTGVSVVLQDPLACTQEQATRIRETLANAGVSVAHANPLYESLVNPEERLRREGVRVLRHTCRVARWLGAAITHVRPGSLNPRGHWLPYPGNTSPETIARLIQSLRETVPAAEDEGVILAVEAGIPSPLDTPERTLSVLQAVGSPAMRFNMDAVNFFGTLEQAYASTSFLHHIFDLLGPYTVCGHIKDVRVEEQFILHINECAPGDGIMDIETYLRRFEAACPDGFVLIEHLPDDEVPRAKRAVDAAVQRAGLAWRE